MSCRNHHGPWLFCDACDPELLRAELERAKAKIEQLRRQRVVLVNIANAVFESTRERCAKVAERDGLDGMFIADAIRALKPEGE